MIEIRKVQQDDREQWAQLFRQYRSFYALQSDETVVDRVWGWITDPSHESAALAATVDDTTMVGIAHHRRFARPSTGTVGLYLDDLFVDPHHRGEGIGRKLLGELAIMAGANGLSVVRWITAESNTRARELYESAAHRTHWLTYDLAPDARSPE
ncbi:GNAT family N-acetyltransferase [Rhodococcoides fascians]|uniref:GNAT family N-acetyltransferase n=1 Tax=Rhodococcoides fascians TaxID=1828 RepID=UPI000B9A73EC|nr:GNAT family N-acetyltransferase [Rhodococcus fascians]OZE85329.1 GNAT family N-acetyltransferase [Rhodococcus fascians]OZF11836.1 GNAT family N-acetyltransferase [Rhodococcus fascians]OZF14605.1 GNAT family N-acetyltransferase [Rhodococcus fascians]OZF71380.1 GNAT family N-acetyltransferase [Rhodococcus fascians]OZF72852.1 GNAT family N-acetyltransferase [Rhodococcus fascians]